MPRATCSPKPMSSFSVGLCEMGVVSMETLAPITIQAPWGTPYPLLGADELAQVPVAHVGQDDKGQPMAGQAHPQQREHLGVVEALHEDTLTQELLYLLQVCDACGELSCGHSAAVPRDHTWEGELLTVQGLDSTVDVPQQWVHVGAMVDAAKVPCRERWHKSGTTHIGQVTPQPNWGAESPFPMTWWRWVTSCSSGMRMSFTSSSSSGRRSSRQQEVALSRGTGDPPPAAPALPLAPALVTRVRGPAGPGVPAVFSTAGTGRGGVRAGSTQHPATPQ